MRSNISKNLLKKCVLLLILVCQVMSGCNLLTSDIDDRNDTDTDTDAGLDPNVAATIVRPIEIDDLLTNPGMGFCDFFGWQDSRSSMPDEHPYNSVYYIRWYWDEIEPSRGNVDFALIDGTIAAAQADGLQLAFRVMVADCEGGTNVPQWLIDLPGMEGYTPGVGGYWPDHENSVFLGEMERLTKALGDRYNGHPDLDHVDIGVVGCWGEWNTAGVGDVASMPSESTQRDIVDWYVEAFPDTTLVIPVVETGSTQEYAHQKGIGWRVDCWGDYGIWGGWSHMEDLYPQSIVHANAEDVWQTAPVQLEVCSVMRTWYERGFDINAALDWALETHASVINLKSSPVPEPWRDEVQEFAKRIGYRYVLTEMQHESTRQVGQDLHVISQWENKGIAPQYSDRPLAYRLRNDQDTVVSSIVRSDKDLKTWLPGSHSASDVLTIPDLPSGNYKIDVAILVHPGETDPDQAEVELAIEGLREDGWYQISEVTIE